MNITKIGAREQRTVPKETEEAKKENVITRERNGYRSRRTRIDSIEPEKGNRENVILRGNEKKKTAHKSKEAEEGRKENTTPRENSQLWTQRDKKAKNPKVCKR